MIQRFYGRSRNTEVRRRAAHAWRVEPLETRRLLSAAWFTEIGGGSHDAHVDGETYVAPTFQPRSQDARRIDLTGIGTSADLPMADSFTEVEPNGTSGTANDVAVAAGVNTISGAVASGTDVDFFRFTLAQRSGVFLDVDSRETGLSTTLNSEIRILAADGVTQLASNDNGDDFETFPLNDTTATARSADSSLYADLNAGTYFIRVASTSSTTGQYLLKAQARTDYSSTVPALNSLPGAADTLFLDFDGHTGSDSWGSYTIVPYDWNGNTAEWTPGEKAAIENVWRVVADDYAPFNVNVTTSFTGTITNAASHRQVIGNSNGSEVGATGSLGVAFLNSYTSGSASNNVSFTFANSFVNYVGSGGASGEIGSKAVEMGNTSSHEFGHALNLRHYGNPNQGNPPEPNPQPNGIMATADFGLSRERWKAGLTRSVESPVVFQTDVDIISSTANTFGYRTDDHGNSTGAATSLGAVTSAGTSRAGVIGLKTDADFFSFTTTGGDASLSVTMLEHVANLDAELHLYDSAGTLITSSDLSTTIFASLTQSLASGTYFAEVRSDGEEGEIGQYTLNVSVAGTTSSATPGTPDLLAASDTGVSNTDNITARDNGTPGQTLQFSVSGTVAGATVSLYSSGIFIGSAVASGTATNVTTNGSVTLTTGNKFITARQTEPGKTESADSASLQVTVDTTSANVDVLDVSEPRTTPVASVNVVFTEAVSGFDFNDLTLTRNGVNVPLSAANNPTSGDDGVNWTIPNLTTPTNPSGTYMLTVVAAGSDIIDLAGNALAANASDTWVNGNALPAVTGVFVAGSTWAANFLTFLGTSGQGDGVAGFRLLAADHGDELPWVNLNRVSVRFSEDVNVAQDDLVIRGVNFATYATSGFSYDPFTFTATWTIAAAAFGNDKILLDLDADAGTGVTDINTNRLDGEWTNPATTPTPNPGGADTFPSGNGIAGGDFRFRLNVLPGDVNRSGGSVIGSDVTLVRNNQNFSPGSAGYTVFRDVNGSATILGSDVTNVRNRQGLSLPAGEPTAPADTGASIVLANVPVLRGDSTAIAWTAKRRLVDDVL